MAIKKRNDYLKHCAFCGAGISLNSDHCPHCGREILDEEINKYHSNVIECIYCGAKGVSYKIVKKDEKEYSFEEEIYTCEKCGKSFKDKDRLGPSFNNSPRIILSSGMAKMVKYLFAFAFAYIFVHFFWNSSPKQTSYDYVQDCNGLQEVRLVDIYNSYKDNKDAAIEMYVDKPFIFEGKIFRIDSDKGMLQVDSENISPEIYINKAEQSKLDKYKAGDTIRVCGIVKTKKTIIAVPIFVENGTIVE